VVTTADTSGILQLQTASTAAVTITAAQNVGIGTASPTNRLDIQAAKAKVFATSTTGTNDCYFAANNTGGAFQIGLDNSAGTEFGTAYAGVLYRSGAYPINFYTNANERMRINSSGNVGIGTTSPSVKLEVNPPTLSGTIQEVFKITDSANSTLALRQTTTVNDINGNHILSLSTGGTERMRIDSSGVAMFGTTNATPAGSSDTKGISIWTNGSTSQIFATGNGDTCAIFNRASSDGATVRLRRQGNDVGNISTTASATAYNTSSDYRLKDNVQPMSGALAKVALLKPVTFKWKIDGSDSEGFIAHELQAIKPDCVSGDKDAIDADGKPVYQGIDTSFLVATLTAALQETKALIDTQAATINAQATMLAGQSAALAALTARIVALEAA
jgi:hypothetical protein